MAKYTTQIKTIVEAGYKIFDFDYPIFDENYRPILEKNIINYYYFREIGLETVGQFKHFLKTRMQIIMPFYNQLYESTGLITKDDYMFNLNSTETHTRTSKGTSKGSVDSTSNGNSEEIFSDTPQSLLAGEDYATTKTKTDGTSIDSSTSEGEADSFEEYTTKMLGGGGLRYNADILMEWRKSFINVDQKIIAELSDLFMNIY